jgi:hypothetical protein
MSRPLQEKNKALLLEGFDVLFNKRDFVGAENSEKVALDRWRTAASARRPHSLAQWEAVGF